MSHLRIASDVGGSASPFRLSIFYPKQSGAGTDSYAWQVDPTSPMPHVGGVNAQFNSLSPDGIPMIEDGTSGWPNGHINPDALAEVKVLVNNYSAEYGGNGNAVVNMVTKGGI